MSSAGLAYTFALRAVSLAPIAQSIIEMTTTPAYGCIINSIRIDFVPPLIPRSGVPSDGRTAITTQLRSANGTGGTPVVPVPLESRNTVPAALAIWAQVIPAGVPTRLLRVDQPSRLIPLEIISADLPAKILLAPNSIFAISIGAGGFGTTTVISLEVYFEEL